MKKPRVLFVSKPIAPPYHDGTKCLVRDVAQNLEQFQPVVMGQRGAEALSGVESLPVYSKPGAFAPGLAQNARAALCLFSYTKAKLWHFVFAPNPNSSRVGALAKQLRHRRVVQTVASPPLSFEGIERWLFGDIVVAQSRYTAQRLKLNPQVAGQRIEVVPPCVSSVAPVSEAACAEVRRALNIPEDNLIFVYPGDLETSTGAETVASAVAALTRAIPRSVVVFACRLKTPAAATIQAELILRLNGLPVRFAGELPSILPLLAASRAVLFPVDDLRGKVDLPIVLLEAMQLRVPLIVAEGGPLDDLNGVLRIPPRDSDALVRACSQLEQPGEERQALIERAAEVVRTEYSAREVARRYEQLYEEALA